MVDSNNNSTVVKYSLRPRCEIRKSSGEDMTDPPPKTGKTTRRRSQPLSKYRRRSANARERSRMREMNEAFETLRRMVCWGSENHPDKTTKISTLRQAMRYITALSEALRDPKYGDGEESSSNRESDRVSECHSYECTPPSPECQNMPRDSFSSSSTSYLNSFLLLGESNVFPREKVTVNKNKTSADKSVCFKKQLNSNYVTLKSSSNVFLQNISLSPTDGCVKEKAKYLSETKDNNLVEESHHDCLLGYNKTICSPDISPDYTFCSVRTIEKSSESSLSNKTDRSTRNKTSGLEDSIENISALVTVQSEYEDSPFLPVAAELGCLPVRQLSFEELFSS